MQRRLRPLDLLRLLLVASIVGPALVLGTIAWLTYRAAFADAEHELTRTSEVAREHASKVFDSFRLVSDRVQDALFGLGDEAVRASELQFHNKLSDIIRDLPQIESLIVVNRDGRLLVATGAYPAPTGGDFSDRDYFGALMKGDAATYISRVQTSRVTGKTFFGWGQVRRDADGARLGVVNIAISPDFFLKFYETLVREASDRRGGRVVTMVRDDGQLLVRYPAAQDAQIRAPSANPFFAAVRQNPDGGVYTNRSLVDAGAPERLFAFRRVPGHPIYIVAGRSVAAIFNEWTRGLIAYFALGIPAALALFLVTLAALHGAAREQEASAQLRDEMNRRRLAEDRLRQAQKMEAVGQLTGGIAHDFNNMLQSITGGLDLMERRIAQGRGDEAGRYIRAMRQASQSASSLTARLLAFSRRQELRPQTIEPNALVLGVEELIRRTIGPSIRLDLRLCEDSWRIDCDANQLENCLLNLAINARDAMPAGGTLAVATAQRTLTASDLSEPDDAKPGDYVEISVSDSGEGMPAEVLERAFEPFFTTKPKGQGTGLGLSQVFGFVKQTGGFIRLESKVGHGSTVRLYLPRNDRPQAYVLQQPVSKSSAAPSAPAAGTILVVEDVADVRAQIAEAVKDMGYDVVTAEDGAAAVRALQSPAGLDLLITDVGLPGLNGRQLAETARGLKPELPILFITGYAGGVLGNLQPAAGIDMLRKPFSLEELAAQVATLLRRPSSAA
jgi:signal transduction histidine kinase